MDKCRLDFGFETSKRQNRWNRGERRQSSAAEWDAMQGKAFRLDGIRASIDPCSYMNLEARCARSPSHRQPVEKESEILVDDV
jgi:hypothetical protein